MACAGCGGGPDGLVFGDQTLELATRTPLAFRPDSVAEHEGDWIRLDAGRVLLKPLSFPPYERRCTITLDVTLRSAGDPWDKSGAVFAFADGDGRRFLERMKEGVVADTSQFAGTTWDSQDAPALELMRFLTPFGAGYFSTHPKAEAWRPVYIDSWADSVHWQRDVSDLQPWFTAADTVWIGVYVDTWTAEGYEVDVAMRWVESDLACDLAPHHRIVPVWNTTRYAHDQRHFTGFPSGPLETALEGMSGRATLELITTGHGGHEGGDEFTPQRHRLLLNGGAVDEWVPWRTDCASFRRFNPSSGSWEVEHNGRTAAVASSDLSRSNWCPGSQVLPRTVELGEWTEAPQRLALEVPGAQPHGPDAFNFWNVSAYLKLEK